MQDMVWPALRHQNNVPSSAYRLLKETIPSIGTQLRKENGGKYYGCSGIGAMVGLSSFQSANQLIRYFTDEKYRTKEDKKRENNPALEWGTNNESRARQCYYNRYLTVIEKERREEYEIRTNGFHLYSPKVHILETGCFVSDDLEIMASLDGILIDEVKGIVRIIEIKCPFNSNSKLFKMTTVETMP